MTLPMSLAWLPVSDNGLVDGLGIMAGSADGGW